MFEVTLGGHSLEFNCWGQASTDRARVECKVVQQEMVEVTLGVIFGSQLSGPGHAGQCLF